MADKQTNLIWIDLEMTGLNAANDRIIELATVVTDSNLNVVAIGPELVISQPKSLLDKMDAWNTRQHNKSGLVTKVLESTITEKNAEQQTLSFLKQHVKANCSPMCGNSVYQDRRFLECYMPNLASFFHYRSLDVSSLKILAKNWMPAIMDNLIKPINHRALEDVHASIDELKYYRKYFLKV